MTATTPPVKLENHGIAHPPRESIIAGALREEPFAPADLIARPALRTCPSVHIDGNPGIPARGRDAGISALECADV